MTSSFVIHTQYQQTLGKMSAAVKPDEARRKNLIIKELVKFF
jgi:hypothetical protein